MQALWMLVASAMFAIMGSFVKLGTEHGASLPLVVLFRGLPSVILLLIWARAGRQSIVPTSWKLHRGATCPASPRCGWASMPSPTCRWPPPPA